LAPASRTLVSAAIAVPEIARAAIEERSEIGALARIAQDHISRIAAKKARWYELAAVMRPPAALASLFAVLGPSIVLAARPMLVLVPEDASPEACFADERIAAVIALTPSTRLVRGKLEQGETLEAARARTGASIAVAGSRRDEGGAEIVSLELAREGKAVEKSAPDKQAAPGVDRVAFALSSVWPKDAPPLATIGQAGAANAAALEATCKKDANAAYAASGAALGKITRDLLTPPGPEQKTLMYRWAKASALRKSGRPKEAIPLLRQVVISLLHGEAAPVWRREMKDASMPSAIDLVERSIVAFENGTFVAIDPKTGLDLWKRELGKAEPRLADAGEGLVLALLEDEIVALDAKTGYPRWRAHLASPSPEIARGNGRLFIAGRENMIALDRAKGEVNWTFDPLADMISGPISTPSGLAVAAGSAIVLVDPSTGTETKRVEVGDEISAPPLGTPKGAVWAMVGGDQAAMIDPGAAEVRVRARDLPGMEWPPAVVSEQLVVLLRRPPNKRIIAYLDAQPKSGIRRAYPGATPPLVALTGPVGVVHAIEKPSAIIARDADGNVMWKSILLKKISDLVSGPEGVAAAVGNKVFLYEPKRGAIQMDVDLGEPVKKVVLGPEGHAALVESGAIYGLPSPQDPRLRSWVRDARMELCRALVDAGEGAVALFVARQVLDKEPEDADALALAAAAEEKPRPKDAAEKWRTLMGAAPARDPVQPEAQRALLRLAGIRARIVLDKPVKDAVLVSADQAVVRLEDSVASIPLVPLAAPVWSKSASQLASFGEGVVRVKDELVRPQDGSVVRKLDSDDVLAKKSLILRVKKSDAHEIGRETADGKEVWRHSFPGADPRILDADQTHIVVTDSSDRGLADMVKAQSGESIWMLPLGARLIAAAISGSKLLFQTERRLFTADAETGKQDLAVPIPPAEVLGVEPIAQGWLVASKQKLRAIDRVKGRVLFQVLFPSPIEHTTIARGRAGDKPKETAIVSLADGTIMAIDLAKGQVRGRLKYGRMLSLDSLQETVLAVEESGALLVIDGMRDLLPEAPPPRIPQPRAPGRQRTSP
jgi:outer membrane protein assembly factor BamB